ncbi:hypothetical protein DFH09DRAFT_1102938 [Mycena vulgaris]|nr:hypothetical protein DFH09DRAFT_1102938 [Mycena vulgaris]
MPTSTQIMSAAQDKAFKREAMRAPDAPRTKELQSWINDYVLPSKSTTLPATTLPTPRRDAPRVYDRLHAQLVQRKARVTALVQLRERALKASSRRWPRYRDIATREQKAHAAKEAQRRDRIRLAAEAETAREMRRAADARVATLMALRGSLPRRLVVLMQMCGLPCRNLLPMARGSIPPDVCREIALLSTPQTVASLSLLGRVCAILLRPLLYRQITVGDHADRLVQTLSTHTCTAALVESLVFEDSFCAYIHDADWQRAVAALVSLRNLTITHYVPLSWNALPLIRFRLRSFTSLGLVVGAWAQFLHLQPELEEIILHSDLLAAPPGRAALPVLRRLSARPDELSKFALLHPLESMVFWVGAPWGVRGLKTHDLIRFGDSLCQLRMLRMLRVNSSQLYILFCDVPQMLITLEHLAIDEDTAWSRNATAEQRLLIRAASAIDGMHAPILKSLTMVCIARPRVRANRTDRAICIDRADAFSVAMRGKCTAPRLCTFHFCAADTCRTWRQWGTDGETIEDAPRAIHVTRDWDHV